MTKKQALLIEAYLIPGLHEAELAGDEVPVPNDLSLKNYIFVHFDRVRRMYGGPHGSRVRELLEAAMSRLTTAAIEENTKKLNKKQADNPFYRPPSLGQTTGVFLDFEGKQVSKVFSKP
jgi:hypothetical protein